MIIIVRLRLIIIDGRIVGLVLFLAQAAIRLVSTQIRLDDDDGGAQAAQIRLDSGRWSNLSSTSNFSSTPYGNVFDFTDLVVRLPNCDP